MASSVVLVTGSSSGFGWLVCEELLNGGHTVLASMRDPEGRNASKADELRKCAGGKAGTLHVIELDVTNESSVNAAVRKGTELAGPIDVVVNNAGFGSAGYTEGFTTEQLEAIFDVNLFGVHRVNRAVLPMMRERRSGLLIHISSTMGRIVLPFAAPYTATKFALEGYAESLHYGLNPSGVDVALIQPGGFGTGFFGAMQSPRDEARTASYGLLADLPQKSWGGIGKMLESEDAPDPRAVADAVVTLIETPAGDRPLRVVVDPMTGGGAAEAINRTNTQVQEQLLTGFGMGDLLRLAK